MNGVEKDWIKRLHFQKSSKICKHESVSSIHPFSCPLCARQIFIIEPYVPVFTSSTKDICDLSPSGCKRAQHPANPNGINLVCGLAGFEVLPTRGKAKGGLLWTLFRFLAGWLYYAWITKKGSKRKKNWMFNPEP